MCCNEYSFQGAGGGKVEARCLAIAQECTIWSKKSYLFVYIIAGNLIKGDRDKVTGCQVVDVEA